MLISSTILAVLVAATAQAADQPKCTDLSGQYRLGAISGACRENGDGGILTFRPYLDHNGPPQDGLYLIPDGIEKGPLAFNEGATFYNEGRATRDTDLIGYSKDSVFIPAGRDFDIQQKGCESLTITYEDMAVNPTTHVTERKLVSRTVALKSAQWKDGALRAYYAHGGFESSDGGPTWESKHLSWALSRDKNGDLIYQATSKISSRLALMPLVSGKSHEELACRLTKVDGQAVDPNKLIGANQASAKIVGSDPNAPVKTVASQAAPAAVQAAPGSTTVVR